MNDICKIINLLIWYKFCIKLLMTIMVRCYGKIFKIVRMLENEYLKLLILEP